MSTTEHRPPMTTPPPPMSAPRPEPAFTEPFPVADPPAPRLRQGRRHRAMAAELAALAFATPIAIPAQRGPAED